MTLVYTFFVNAPLPGVLLCIIIIISPERLPRPSVFFALHILCDFNIFERAKRVSLGAHELLSQSANPLGC